jgi:hypothetical protein
MILNLFHSMSHWSFCQKSILTVVKTTDLFRWDVIYDNDKFSVNESSYFRAFVSHITDRKLGLSNSMEQRIIEKISLIDSRISSNYLEIKISLAFLTCYFFSRFHNNPALVIVMRQINQLYHFQFHSSKSHFTIILT